MNTDLEKKNMPELLTDWNGYPVQAWIMGGRTITVSGGQFVCESTLMRLCNTGSSVARIKLAGIAWDVLYKDATDTGMPVLPGESMIVGVMKAGQVYEVEGSLDVTFFYDRRARNAVDIPEYPEFSASIISQIKWGEEISTVEGNKISFAGLIPWTFEDPRIGRAAGNRVGVKISPSMNAAAFPDAVIEFRNMQDLKLPVKRYALRDVLELNADKAYEINYWPLIKAIPFDARVDIRWVPGNADYDETFHISIDKDSDSTLQKG